MGLLGDSFDDPKTMATLALAGGLMSGRTFGQGLLGGLQSYQGSLLGAQQLQEAQQKSALEKFQLQRLQDWQKITMGDGSSQQASPQQAPPTQQANTQQAPPMQQSPAFDFANPDAQQPQQMPQSMPQGGGNPMLGQQSQSVQQPASGSGFAYPLPGLTDQQSRTIAASMQPGEYMKMYADKAAPQTDITKLMVAQGIDLKSPLGQMLLQQATVKANYVAPTRIGEGAYNDPVTGIQGLPTTAPPGYINVRSPNGTWSTQKVANGLDAVEAAKTAEKTGVAAATSSVAYDSNNKPIFSTGKQDLLRATGATSSSLPPPQPATSNFTGSPEFISEQISGIKDPQERSNALAAFEKQFRTNPNFNTAQGMVTPVPQMGAIANSDASQKASADTMHQSYAKLQSGNSTANAALEMIEKMKVLASNKNPLLTAGVLGINQSAVNPDAAEYEKQRANLITLIAAQSGTNGTDAGRALTGDSIPDFGKPNKAIQDGLGSLKNQLISQTQLKASVMTPSYQAGDSKAYTDLENGYDQNITPSMVPILKMPPGQSRDLLIKSASNDPAMKAKFDWAKQNGLLGSQPSVNSAAPQASGLVAPKTASMSDIAATAKASGKSTAQVTAALRAKGYTIGGQ